LLLIESDSRNNNIELIRPDRSARDQIVRALFARLRRSGRLGGTLDVLAAIDGAAAKLTSARSMSWRIKNRARHSELGAALRITAEADCERPVWQGRRNANWNWGERAGHLP